MAEPDHAETPRVYALTALTREAGSARRVVVLGFDAPLRGVVITFAALAVAALPTTIAWLLIGPVALIVTALIVAGVFYLVEHRTRSGLQLRTYQAMADRRSERIGQFICCGRRVYPNRTGFGLIRRSSMPTPYHVPAREAVDRLFSPTVVVPREGPSTAPAHAAPTVHASPSRPARRPRRRRGADPFAELARHAGRVAPERPVDKVA